MLYNAPLYRKNIRQRIIYMMPSRLPFYHQAAFNGNLDLLVAEVNTALFNLKDDKGHTPLYYAIERGHVEVVKYLVRYTSDIKSYIQPDFHKSNKTLFSVLMDQVQIERKTSTLPAAPAVPVDPSNKESMTDAEALAATESYISQNKKDERKLTQWFDHAKLNVSRCDYDPAYNFVIYFKDLNSRLAFYWVERATKSHHPKPDILGALGDYLRKGFGKFANQAEREKAIFQAYYKMATQKKAVLILAASNLGSVQNQLALNYLDGIGTLKNDCEAEKWFLKSAAKGIEEAMMNLAMLYKRNGDEIKSLEWLQRAVDQGSLIGKYRLGHHYLQSTDSANLKRAVKLFTEVIEVEEAKDISLQTKMHYKKLISKVKIKLADCYREGLGVARDDLIASHWYEKSAPFTTMAQLLGLSQCYFYLGRIKEAAALHPKMESLEGCPCLLADRYQYGRFGCTQDTKYAEKLYRKAARLGCSESQYMTARVYLYHAEPNPKREQQALKWLRMAAEQGHEIAAVYLQSFAKKEVAPVLTCSLVPENTIELETAAPLAPTPSPPVPEEVKIKKVITPPLPAENKDAVPLVKEHPRKKRKPKKLVLPGTAGILTPEVIRSLEKKPQGNIAILKDHLSPVGYETLLTLFNTFRENGKKLYGKGSLVLFLALVFLKIPPTFSPKNQDIDLEIDCTESNKDYLVAQMLAKNCGFKTTVYHQDYINMSLALADNTRFELTIRKNQNSTCNPFPFTRGKLFVEKNGHAVIEDMPVDVQQALKNKVIPTDLPSLNKKNPGSLTYCFYRLYKLCQKLTHYRPDAHTTAQFFSEPYLREYLKNVPSSRYDFYGEIAILIKNKLLFTELAKPILNAFVEVLIYKLQEAIKRNKTVKFEIVINPEKLSALLTEKINRGSVFSQGWMSYYIQQLSLHVIDSFQEQFVDEPLLAALRPVISNTFNYIPPPSHGASVHKSSLFNSPKKESSITTEYKITPTCTT